MASSPVRLISSLMNRSGSTSRSADSGTEASSSHWLVPDVVNSDHRREGNHRESYEIRRVLNDDNQSGLASVTVHSENFIRNKPTNLLKPHSQPQSGGSNYTQAVTSNSNVLGSYSNPATGTSGSPANQTMGQGASQSLNVSGRGHHQRSNRNRETEGIRSSTDNERPERDVPMYTNILTYTSAQSTALQPQSTALEPHSRSSPSRLPVEGAGSGMSQQRSSSLQHLSGSVEHIVSISDDRQLIRPAGSNLSLDVVGSDLRHPRRPRSSDHTPGLVHADSGNIPHPDASLPDLLNSHALPPYRPNRNSTSNTIPNGSSRHSHRNERAVHRLQNSSHHDASRRNREQSRRRRHRRRSRRRQTGATTLDNLHDREKFCCTKWCCLSCLTVFSRFRWVLFSLALLGVFCVIAGIVLGALHMSGSSFLTLSLMFIGLGVMLVIVVVLGWKCTPIDHEPCHLLFNLGVYSNQELDRRVRHVHHHRERGLQWHAGVMYSEFRYRRPPPSYNAAMQDYNQQLVMAHQMNLPNSQDNATDGSSLPSSPPPTYRSQASVRPGLHITFPRMEGGEFPTSRPPTYRSHISTFGPSGHQRPAIDITSYNDDDQSQLTHDSPAIETDSVSVDQENLTSGEQDTTSVTISSNNDPTNNSTGSNNRTEEDNQTINTTGFEIVEGLETMLNATLSAMDSQPQGGQGSGSGYSISEQDSVSVVVPEDTQL